MPGSFTSVFLVAFDHDDRGQTVQAFPPRRAANEAEARHAAHALAGHHAGVVVWKREASPVVGEEGEPVIIWKTGTIGDFD